jgi:putative membrane protein
MIIELKIPWKRILKDLKYVMIFIVIYMSSISIIDFYYPMQSLHIPIALITVPGTVIALLLGFRTNSAYDRWWEARIIWGAIVNDSRTWVRQLLTFVDCKGNSSIAYAHVRKMAMRHIAWNYALTGHLRKLDTTPSFEDRLDVAEMRTVKTKTNVPNALLYNQGQDLKTLRESQLIDQYQFVSLDQTLTRFTDSMGKCERIKNTVFPTSYSLLVDVLIYMWIFFLPLGLIDNIGLFLIPTTVSLAFSFLAIDRIAYYMQDPFDNIPSDTPMMALSRTIEINILEELEEKSIPHPLLPINGVLM